MYDADDSIMKHYLDAELDDAINSRVSCRLTLRRVRGLYALNLTITGHDSRFGYT